MYVLDDASSTFADKFCENTHVSSIHVQCLSIYCEIHCVFEILNVFLVFRYLLVLALELNL